MPVSADFILNVSLFLNGLEMEAQRERQQFAQTISSTQETSANRKVRMSTMLSSMMKSELAVCPSLHVRILKLCARVAVSPMYRCQWNKIKVCSNESYSGLRLAYVLSTL